MIRLADIKRRIAQLEGEIGGVDQVFEYVDENGLEMRAWVVGDENRAFALITPRLPATVDEWVDRFGRTK